MRRIAHWAPRLAALSLSRAGLPTCRVCVPHRRARGDGNCFFRSFCFGYLEGLLRSSDSAERDRCGWRLARRATARWTLRHPNPPTLPPPPRAQSGLPAGGAQGAAPTDGLRRDWCVHCASGESPARGGRACLAPGGASGSLCTALPPPPHTHTHTRAHKLAFASLRGAAGHGASHAAGRGVGAGAADARGAGDQHARGNDQVGGVSAGCCVPEAALHVCASAGGARSGGWVDPRPRPPRCSNYAVWLLRMLTSCEIKRRADFFAPFVMVRGRQRRCAGCVGSSHAAGARLSGACLRLCATPLAGPGRL